MQGRLSAFYGGKDENYWKVRVKNRHFWLSLIPAICLLVQAIGAVFGLELDLTETGNRILDVVNAAFIVLSLLGVVNDPTTAGYHDSDLAMTYEVPKDDRKGEANGS